MKKLITETTRTHMFSGVQPEAIAQTLFSSAEHLINPFASSVEMKCGRVAYVLSRLGTLINISIHKALLWKLATHFAECRNYLTANTAPDRQSKQPITYDKANAAPKSLKFQSTINLNFECEL